MSYKRIMLKLSGEALMGKNAYGLDFDMLKRVALEIKELSASGLEISIVVGGGNIFRGVNGSKYGIDRPTSDDMGMLATVINSLALRSIFETLGVDARVMSALAMPSVCERYVRLNAMDHLENGRVVICAAGSGNPYFTTDTAAVLRASELNCEVVLKGTKVNGVYTQDPEIYPDAIHSPRLSYDEVIHKELHVMDATSTTLAKENNLPILVFSIQEEGNIRRCLQGEGLFTLINNQ